MSDTFALLMFASAKSNWQNFKVPQPISRRSVACGLEHTTSHRDAELALFHAAYFRNSSEFQPYS